MSVQQQLQKIVKKTDLNFKFAANKIAEEVKERLREAVNDLWYGKYTPKDYERTYELISAITSKVIKNGKGDYSIEIFFDPEVMSTHSALRGWGTHSGFESKDFRQGLIASIIHGMGGSANNPRKGEATNVIEVVQEEATKLANDILKQYL